MAADTKPPEPWSDEWICSQWDSSMGGFPPRDAVIQFARAVAAKAMEEAANRLDIQRYGIAVPAEPMLAMEWLHDWLTGCVDTIRARAKEIADGK